MSIKQEEYYSLVKQKHQEGEADIEFLLRIAADYMFLKETVIQYIQFLGKKRKAEDEPFCLTPAKITAEGLKLLNAEELMEYWMKKELNVLAEEKQYIEKIIKAVTPTR